MSINDFLTSEMSVWIEIILLGLCFLCGVAVIVLGVIFTTRKHSSRLLGGILILHGSAYALSIGYAFLIIILSRTSGQETIHIVSNIYTYAGMLLNLAKYVLLLVFCRVVMKCKVWVIPVSVILALVSNIAMNRTNYFWYPVLDQIKRGKELDDSSLLPVIICFIVVLITSTAGELIIVAVMRKGRDFLPQYSKISTFYIVFLCISFVSSFTMFANLLDSFVYALIQMGKQMASITAWIVFGAYLIRRANACLKDN